MFTKISQFANPELFWLLFLLVPMVGVYFYQMRQGQATMTISTTEPFRGVPRGWRYYLRHAPFVLRCVAVALIIMALARPQSTEQVSNSSTRGIDIILAMDVSTSMLARDFDPDRFTAAKDVAAKFIADRRNDRIGVVVFAGESFTQSPLTTDKASLQTLLSQIHIGMIDDGTAIGNGLATAINRLRDSDAKSKVIILLTDGVNNAGQVAPMTAAEIAARYGIKVYTIGVGTRGQAPSPTLDRWGRLVFVPARVEIDEETLTRMAEATGGRYFRATDNQTLTAVYEEINTLEKTDIETSDFLRHTELFGIFVLWALMLLAAEFLLRSLVFRKIP